MTSVSAVSRKIFIIFSNTPFLIYTKVCGPYQDISEYLDRGLELTTDQPDSSIANSLVEYSSL